VLASGGGVAAALRDDLDGSEPAPGPATSLEDDAIEAAFARRFAAARASSGAAMSAGDVEPERSAASRAGPLLRIRALGPVSFTPDNGLSSRFATQAKPFQLLLALACTPPGSVGWEQLCGMLWPEEDLAPAQARNRFHRLMNELRGLLAGSMPGLPREAIRAANGSYALDPAYIASDVHEFLAALDRVRDADGDLDEAIAALAVARDRWTGELCTGQVAEWLTPSDGARLADRYARQLTDAGRRLAARAARQGRWPEARLLYGLLLEEDPCNVEWVRPLMTACAELGDARGVLAVEAAHAAALGEGFGVDGDDNPADLAVSPEIQRHREAMLARARDVKGALAGMTTPASEAVQRQDYLAT
jgi:DNA-binding SARP family transcriptional activator